MQDASNTRMSCYTCSHFTVCDPQSSAQLKIRHGVSWEYEQSPESTNIWQLADRWQTPQCENYVLCTPRVCVEAATDIRARGSKFKVHCHYEVTRADCMYTARNSMYFVEAAAVRTERKNKKYVVRLNAHSRLSHMTLLFMVQGQIQYTQTNWSSCLMKNHSVCCRLEFSTGLKITTRPGPRVFKPKPNAARHTRMNCLPEPDPPARLHCFPHTLVIVCSGVRSASAPSNEAAKLTLHHTWTAMIHNKQYIIYNLQEICFMKKEAWGPTRPGSFAYFFIPNLQVQSGLSGRPDLLRTLLQTLIHSTRP